MPDTLSPAVTDVVELTRTLVRCESVTPREAGALQHLERTETECGQHDDDEPEQYLRGEALRVLLYLFGRDDAVRYLRTG